MRQGSGQLRLANTRGAQEYEAAHGAFEVLHPCPCTTYRIRHYAYGVLLAYDPLV